MKYWPEIIAKPLAKNQLLESLRAQLAKDLQLELEQIPHQKIDQWLGQWLDSQMAKIDLAQILYRIDLPLETAMSTENLALRILEREAQKVIFRAQYSGRI